MIKSVLLTLAAYVVVKKLFDYLAPDDHYLRTEEKINEHSNYYKEWVKKNQEKERRND